MTEAEARAELEAMVEHDSYPELSPAEIDQLVRASRRVDSAGLVYGDTGWEPTFDLNAGARRGWLRKAGKAAGDFAFSDEGQSFRREQVHEHCLAMAEQYRRGVAGSISLVDGDVCTDIVGNVNV